MELGAALRRDIPEHGDMAIVAGSHDGVPAIEVASAVGGDAGAELERGAASLDLDPDGAGSVAEPAQQVTELRPSPGGQVTSEALLLVVAVEGDALDDVAGEGHGVVPLLRRHGIADSFHADQRGDAAHHSSGSKRS